MIMFVTGGGGMGKTEAIKAIEAYYRQENVSNKLMLSSATAYSANLMSDKS